MATRRACRHCGGPLRLAPIGLGRLRYVHTAHRTAGTICRAQRAVFGDRPMDQRQAMLPGMEWTWAPPSPTM